MERDRPFAGSLVPMASYHVDRRVSSLMVEVRRGVYMDEGSGARLPGFDSTRSKIHSALRGLVAEFRSMADG